MTRTRIHGTMLWFAEARDYGYILTESEERLYVDREGFVDRAAPIGRCAGLPVQLKVSERDGRRIAVEVAPIAEVSPRRARRRTRSY